MAKYNDAVCKLCRREGQKLFLKGERCLSPKCAVEKRPYPPGPHGKQAAFRRKTSDYGLQLREKQKARRIYGVMEKQFRRYFKEANRRKGLTGTILLTILETRLDNVIYRLGFADSRSQARQLVRHGHFNVNGHKTDIPSYIVNVGDKIEVRSNSASNNYFKERMQLMQSSGMPPEWLTRNAAGLSGSVAQVPTREDIDIQVNEQLIVEYYNR